MNVEAGAAAYDQAACRNGSYVPEAVPIISKRVHPQFANVDNEPDKLVTRGQLTVPILHLWNPGDGQTCGTHSMLCPLRDGTTVTLGSTDCSHEPLELAIAAQGLTSKSLNMRLGVDDAVQGLYVRRARRHDGRGAHQQRPRLAERLPHSDRRLGARPDRRRLPSARGVAHRPVRDAGRGAGSGSAAAPAGAPAQSLVRAR